MDKNNEQGAKRLSGWFYAIPAAILLSGFLGFGTYLYLNIKTLTAQMPQLVVPGDHSMNLDVADEYIVFHEYESVVDGHVYSSSLATGLNCSLEPAVGQPITLEKPDGKYKYSIGTRSGKSLYKFDIKNPGQYKFSCVYDNSADKPEIVLAIGQGFLTELLRIILGGMTLLAASTLVASGALVFILMKRRKG